MAISPAIDEAQMQPTPDDEQRLFEEKFGQMSYQVFSSQFPDLVGSIVTFKLLDSDLDKGSGSGSFILEHHGSFIYVPVILADNQLKPFDMMYVKDKDIFLPLTEEWIEEVGKGSLAELGEGSKLPETVATDVDIRNIMVPPTTGRYSYASANEVSPRNKLAADASQPLGMRLHKYAQGEMIAAGAQGGAPMGGGMPMGGMPAPPGGQGGPGSAQPFDPEVWATFVEQFQRIQGTTPGAALDSGSMDLESLGKMYKSHTKTWEMAPDPNQTAGMAPAADLGMPQAPMDPNAMPPAGAAPAQPMQRTASVGSEASKVVTQAAQKITPTLGQKLDDFASLMGSGAAGGAAIGGVRAGMDQELSDVPGGMIRGAIGGAIGAPIGRAIGTAAGKTMAGQKYTMPGDSRTIGSILGGATGGFIGARGEKTNYDKMRHPFSYNRASPYGNMTVTASDHNANLSAMIKHAVHKKSTYQNALPSFLKAAPNTVKQAFAQVLSDNPSLLKQAGDIYGEATLVDCLTPVEEKTAGMSEGGGQLYVADKDTPSAGFHASFGDAAPEAFNGVLLRGYHFKDTRPGLNLAVQTQEYHDFTDPRESGVYMLFPINETPEPALVITQPYDLLGEDRVTYPKSVESVTRLKTKVPKDSDNVENDVISQHATTKNPDKDVERSHVLERLFILGNGDYGLCHHIMGEQIAEIALEGTPVFKTVMTDGENPPKAGKGMFVYKRGIHYFGTKPVELSEIKNLTNKTIRGKVSAVGGWGAKNFVIDAKSPLKRPIRPRGEDIVIIPASWKWLPLNDSVNASDYMRNASTLTYIMLDAMGSMGVSEIVARSAGQDMYAVDGGKTNDKKAALVELAKTAHIHASAAEAMLKIAEKTGKCAAHIVTKHQYDYLMTKVAQPPMPMAPTPQVPPQVEAPPPPMPPAMAEDPGMMNSPIDQAFQESMDDMQTQMSQLMAQMQVLQTVQERAMQIEQGGGEAPPPEAGMDPNAAPPMDPGMAQQPPMQGGMDPNMMAPPGAEGEMPPEAMADPAMQDPAMQEEAPPPPIMRTEQPSSQEIASQINPDFLEQAGQFQQQGAFDAGALGSLAKNPSLKEMSSQYSANLEDSVDDLGRTLLTLYMQESELKEQLGDEAFIKLETQLRDTFKGLGDLTLNLTHNTAHVEDSAQA